MNKYKKCFYVRGETTIIDVVHPTTGRSVCFGQDLETIQQRYPDAELMDLDEASELVAAAQRARYCSAPKFITAERFHEMRDILPPEDYVIQPTSASFKFNERLAGSVTRIFARVGDDYFELVADYTLKHNEIIALCRKVVVEARPWVMQVKLAGEWTDIRPKNGWVYRYATEAEAVKMLSICYPDQLREARLGAEETVRVVRKAI